MRSHFLPHLLFPTLCGLLPAVSCSSGGETSAQPPHRDHDHQHQAPAASRPDPGGAGEEEQCEHGIPTIECPECRYEVGAVEVAPELLDPKGDNLIEIKPVSLSAQGGWLALTGEVAFDARKVVHLTPRITGLAVGVFVDLGDRVEAGARLVEIDSLELGQLRSNLLQAGTRLRLAKTSYDREKQLHEKRISSQSELLKAEAELEEARVALATAKEQLNLLGIPRSSLEQPSESGGKTGRMIFRSPMAGTVVAKQVTPGERISPEKEILTVADLSTVWVWASAYETDLAPLLEATRTGPLPAVVRVAAFESREFPGRVDYVGATMDEATRTVKVRIVVDNPAGLLRPGMFADALVELGRDAQSVLVPAEAVVNDGNKRFVFVRIGERRFMRRDVQTRATRSGLTEIASGLRAGEEIVVRGAFLLKSDILREKMGAGCAD